MPNHSTIFTDDDGENVTIMFYEGGEFQKLFHGTIDELSDRMEQETLIGRLDSQPESKPVASGRDRQPPDQ